MNANQAGAAWSWGHLIPSEWFAPGVDGCVMVRGYLALNAEVPESDEVFAVWSGRIQAAATVISWVRGAFDVPSPVEYQYVGGGTVLPNLSREPVRVPPGVYVVIAVPIHEPMRAVTPAAERAAVAKIEVAAGLLSAFVSPNTTLQQAFVFLSEARGTHYRSMGPPIRRPGPVVALNTNAFERLGAAARAIAGASGNIPARAATAMRWYAKAQSERSRPDAFVNFWIALEALAFGGNARTGPLTRLLGAHYGRDDAWIRETFGIEQLAQLRADIIHNGQRPMVHGNLLAFVDALFVDALHARLGMPLERRAEGALPNGRPLRVRELRNSGAVATGFLRTESVRRG